MILTEEISFFKQRYQIHELQSVKLQDELKSLRDKLKLTESQKHKLETENDRLECTLRNYQFKIQELEECHYHIQEQNILLRNDIEEIAHQKTNQMLELTEKIQNTYQDTKTDEIPVRSLEYIAILSSNILNVKATDKHIYYNDKGVNKIFEFDSVAKLSLMDYIKQTVNSSKGHISVICYGFKNISGLIEKIGNYIPECVWTCTEFLDLNEKSLQTRELCKNDIKLYSSVSIRKRNYHYAHIFRSSLLSLQLIDICDIDPKSQITMENIINYLKSSHNSSIYANVIPTQTEKISILFNIATINTLQNLNITSKIWSNIQGTSSTENTSTSCIKENNFNLLYLVNKYKKQIALLKNKIAEDQKDKMISESKIKLREKELSLEINALKQCMEIVKKSCRGRETVTTSVLGSLNCSYQNSPSVRKGSGGHSESARKLSKIGRPKSFNVQQNYENLDPVLRSRNT